jgi:parvulin-like peptidyl-prolyl isomerase
VRTATTRMSALLVALAVLVGCSSQPTGAAATVNGIEIPRAELEAAVHTLAGVGLEGLEAADRAAIVEPLQHRILTMLIQTVIIEQAAAERGIEVDPTEIREMVASQTEEIGGTEALEQTLAAQSLTLELFLDRLVPTQARLDEIQAQLLGDLDDVDLRTVRHILVETLEDAEDLLDQLDGGADFAELAMAHSIDTGSGMQGGELGPAMRGQYVPGFEDAVWAASPNELVGPVETTFGFHLLEVTAVETTPASDLDRQLAQQMVGGELDRVLLAILDEADISIAPGLGVWDPNQNRVVSG